MSESRVRCASGVQVSTFTMWCSAHRAGMTWNQTAAGSAALAMMRPTASGASGTLRDGMERTTYDLRSWRNLPREFCVIEYLFGDVVGECVGIIDLHHVRAGDPDSRSIPVCHRHHPQLEATLRRLSAPERAWKRCRHRHSTPESRKACEEKLNRVSAAA